MGEVVKPSAPRKPRGAALEITPLLSSIERDPISAMQAVADEAAESWRTNAPTAKRALLDAVPKSLRDGI